VIIQKGPSAGRCDHAPSAIDDAKNCADAAPALSLPSAAQFNAWCTESSLAVLAQIVPSAGDFLERVLDALSTPSERFQRRLARRNAVLVEIAALMPASSRSGQAKAIAGRLDAYLRRSWSGERNLAAPPAGARPLGSALWRFVNLNDGDGLGWKQILHVLDE
jgi:hypothetical protein